MVIVLGLLSTSAIAYSTAIKFGFPVSIAVLLGIVASVGAALLYNRVIGTRNTWPKVDFADILNSFWY